MGGILIAAIGLSGAILFDVASFFLSALIICCIHSKEITEKAEVDIHKSIYLLKEGFRYVKGMPLLIVICACAMLMNMLLVPYNSFQAPYILSLIHIEMCIRDSYRRNPRLLCNSCGKLVKHGLFV